MLNFSLDVYIESPQVCHSHRTKNDRFIAPLHARDMRDMRDERKSILSISIDNQYCFVPSPDISQLLLRLRLGLHSPSENAATRMKQAATICNTGKRAKMPHTNIN